MKIGIDIDGVLTDIESWQLEQGSKYFYSKGATLKEPFSKHISTMFGVSKDEDAKFWADNVFEYAKTEPARKYASEITNKLKQDGHKIYIITARSYTSEDSLNGEKMRSIVKKWLKDNNIYFDYILFTPHDKVPTIVDNQIELMIEDTPRNITDISQIIPVICFHAEYNKMCKGKNIYTAYSWYDVYDKITINICQDL